MYSNEPVEFTINVQGEKTGEDYPGVFKSKPRLSHMEVLKMDQVRRDLLGPRPELASKDAMAVADAFSKIWAHLVIVKGDATPKWFIESGLGINLSDEAPVGAIYENVLRVEREAQEAISKKAEEARATLQKKVDGKE